jgi:hypothetical protein
MWGGGYFDGVKSRHLQAKVTTAEKEKVQSIAEE